MVREIADHVTEVWTEKDSGIWEVRGEPRHFVYSKLMCWVAMDRSIKMAEERGFPEIAEQWRKVSKEIREVILNRGFNKKLNSFVQSFEIGRPSCRERV